MKITDAVKRYLNGAWYYSKKADDLEERMVRLRSKAEKVTTSFSDVPTFGSFEDHRQAVMDEMMDVERERRKMVWNCRQKLKEIEIVIGMLEDYQERLVLEYRYLHFENWQDIAYALHYTERQTHNIHSSALIHLLDIDKKVIANGGESMFSGKTMILSLLAEVEELKQKIKDLETENAELYDAIHTTFQ